MKYLCMTYEEERRLNDLSPCKWGAPRAEALAYVEVLRKSGYLVTLHALQSAWTAGVGR